MASDTDATGFIGLGTMGKPMVRSLLRAQKPVIVWNRSPEKCVDLKAAGADVAVSRDALFASCNTVILMLANSQAMDSVLACHQPEFFNLISGHIIINMGTTTPQYSYQLCEAISAAGGHYVEAPVSGSRKQAEAGQLVGMLAGAAADVKAAQARLTPMLSQSFECGPVPAALKMKLAVNVFLITMVTGLAEGMHFAARHGLNLNQYAEILAAGPMASDVSRIKADKLRRKDFTRQAGISDVLKNSRLIVEAAQATDIPLPLMEQCLALYDETEALGLGKDDMVSVIKAIEARTRDKL